MSDDDENEITHEERGIYLVMALAGLPVLIGVLVEGGELDAGATISLACVVLALVGLAHLRRIRLPKVVVSPPRPGRGSFSARRAPGSPRRLP